MDDINCRSSDKFQEKCMENTIINMYKSGYSIDFIVKKYYKYKNKKQKPIKINGIVCYPAKIYTMDICRTYVIEVIYNYLMSVDKKHPQAV